ncbi:MAG: SRPBCC family protein [Erythrobacter sp.]
MPNRNTTKLGVAAALLAAPFSAPASAEVVESSDDGFITRDEVVVDATLKQTWLALISPADWWSAEHTWSADAANLTLMPTAGGCFCEKIPEVDEPDRFTLEGSVEHMRVIQAYPERALRMVGGLGPLQSEPVTGVLTIALSEAEGGTRIVWEYNVGGPMRYEIPVISKAVDGVMTIQLNGLAQKLGLVDEPENAPDEDPASEDGTDGETESATIEGDSVLESEGPATSAETDEAEDGEKDDGPSVEEAFGDLSAPGQF